MIILQAVVAALLRAFNDVHESAGGGGMKETEATGSGEKLDGEGEGEGVELEGEAAGRGGGGGGSIYLVDAREERERRFPGLVVRPGVSHWRCDEGRVY